MKLVAILLLFIASIAVLAGAGLLVATLILGLGVDVPDGWAFGLKKRDNSTAWRL